jgi:3(or 17)beta-hydroxysteroid dehydrogenase
MLRLQNKTALITGSARGIGKAIAELFHTHGATIIITDIRHDEGAELLQRYTKRAEYHELDVTQESAWQTLSQRLLQRFGSIDIVVNNAGITGFLECTGPFDPEHTMLDSWNTVHAVNMTGVMLGCKYGIAMMKHHGGSIINISSRSGIVGIPLAVAYASSKAAVRNHTKSVALYCAEKKYAIRCNSIHPAAIMTPMWDAMLGHGADREKLIASIESGIPLGRFGMPEDVAYGALYLASDESKYVTGTELHIDGGILAGSTAQPE